MNPKKLLLFLSAFTALSIAACDTSESDKTEKPVYDYVFLNVGDIRQIEGDFGGLKFYETDEITGKTKRTDSLEVYVMKVNSQFYGAIYNEYYFIRDGYYYFTELDSSFGSESIFGNPYGEQKLAKVNPEEGDTWHRYQKDTSSFTTEFINVKTAAAGTFLNVVGLNLSSPDMTVYYAADYGYIGTAQEGVDNYSVNYVKSGEKEIGELVPMDTTSFSKMNKKDINGARKSFFGRSIK